MCVSVCLAHICQRLFSLMTLRDHVLYYRVWDKLYVRIYAHVGLKHAYIRHTNTRVFITHPFLTPAIWHLGVGVSLNDLHCSWSFVKSSAPRNVSPIILLSSFILSIQLMHTHKHIHTYIDINIYIIYINICILMCILCIYMSAYIYSVRCWL